LAGALGYNMSMKTETYEKYKKAWDRRLKEEEKELDRKGE